MTASISLVAVCCSRASASSRLRALLVNKPCVLDGDHRLVRKGLQNLICLSEKGRTSCRRI